MKIENILQGKDLVLQFLGVSDFNNQVVFAKIAENSSKATLKEITGKSSPLKKKTTQ